MWVHVSSISPTNMSLISPLTTNIYCRTGITGNTDRQRIRQADRQTNTHTHTHTHTRTPNLILYLSKIQGRVMKRGTTNPVLKPETDQNQKILTCRCKWMKFRKTVSLIWTISLFRSRHIPKTNVSLALKLQHYPKCPGFEKNFLYNYKTQCPPEIAIAFSKGILSIKVLCDESVGQSE